MFQDALPAYDLNCAMYARAGDVARFDADSTSLRDCRLAILPNHAIALFWAVIPINSPEFKNAVSPNSLPIALILASEPALTIANPAMSTVPFAYEG